MPTLAGFTDFEAEKGTFPACFECDGAATTQLVDDICAAP